MTDHPIPDWQNQSSLTKGLEGEKPPQELQGLHQGFFHGSPQCSQVRACSYHPNGKSISSPIQKERSQQEEPSSQQKMPPPGFVEIMKSLHGDDPPHVAIKVPLVLTKGQGHLQMWYPLWPQWSPHDYSKM